MVRFGMIGDDVVQPLDAQQIQVIQQYFRHFTVDRINQNGLFAALDKISVITGAIRQRNERIKETPVPIDSSDGINPRNKLSRFHFRVSPY